MKELITLIITKNQLKMRILSMDTGLTYKEGISQYVKPRNKREISMVTREDHMRRKAMTASDSKR